jgi:hypothetical protein
MRRVSVITLLLAFVVASGCNGKSGQQAAKASPSVAASPAVSPPVSGPVAAPSVQATIPANIQDRLRRPLTDQEIMQLPPETRDMILRAQGKPIPTPTKKK